MGLDGGIGDHYKVCNYARRARRRPVHAITVRHYSIVEVLKKKVKVEEYIRSIV